VTVIQSPFPTLEEFRFWLGCMLPDAVIAEGWDCESCPLALFLRSCGFQWTPAVFSNGRWSPTGRKTPPPERRPLPAWAREFTYWIDKSNQRSMTPSEALFILDQPFFKPQRWETA
jgi:hypothetical protein